MKEQFVTTVRVRGNGISKVSAFTDALGQVQRAVLLSTRKVLLRIEPREVKVIQARYQCKRERFLFFFLARKRYRYSIELEITASVSAVDTESINFTLQ